SPRYLLAATFSVMGAAIIKVQGTPSGDIWIGFALMQVAGISFAYGQIAYRDWKSYHTTIDNLAVFSMLTFGGALCAGAFSLFFSNTEHLAVSAAQWQAIMYLGCIASGLGFYLWNKGATLSNTGELAAFNNALVPLAMFVSLFIFKESQPLVFEDLFRLLTGGFFVVTAVIIATKKVSVSE
ncbi:MAG: EamA family transporter, partial [Puniceicoccaceae bacterium]|nr:EamA family transporter [Puniceicoccaceae bacterium]